MKNHLGLMFCLATMIRSAICFSGETVDANDAGYMDHLRGSWDMVGSMGGKPLHYIAKGSRVLQGGFLRLHMLDANFPPRYEADLYLGFDAAKKDYIAHWMDRFGAAGARVVGEGRRTGSTLIITFPYTEAGFRDTFNWDAVRGTWSLLLESEASDGTWSTFASYALSAKQRPR